MPKRRNLQTDSADEVPPKKHTKLIWKEAQTFQNEEEKKEFLKKNDVWKIRNVRKEKIFYYCNAVSIRRGAPCPAKVYVHNGILNKQVLMSNGKDHEHERPDQFLRQNLLPDNVKHAIGDMVNLGLKPRIISHNLRENHGVAPNHIRNI